MFHNTSLRLAGLYLLIIMTISLLFSVSLFNISTREIDRGLERQKNFVNNLPDDRFRLPPSFQKQITQNRVEVADDTKSQLFTNLVIANIAVLILSGLLSYILARLSLRPIEKTHRELEQFTADASHEMRTPLASIRSETEVALMQKKITDQQARKVFKSNLEEIDSITSLTESLLKLARNNNKQIITRDYNLFDLVESAKQKINSVYIKDSTKINITSFDKDIIVRVDKLTFIEVIVILLDNAVKYSRDGGEVIVSTLKQRDYALVSIKDFGIGIDKKDLPHIFDRFYKSDKHRSKTINKGHGLGLSIAKRLLDKQNCGISVNSKKGEFTEFKITVPLSSR